MLRKSGRNASRRRWASDMSTTTSTRTKISSITSTTTKITSSPSPRKNKILFTSESSTLHHMSVPVRQRWPFVAVPYFVGSRRSLLQITIFNERLTADDYHIWKIKLELAKGGSPQAIEQLKNQFLPFVHSTHPFVNANYTQLLSNSTIHQLNKGNFLGDYEAYASMPTFLLIKGKAVIQCSNTDREIDILCSADKGGILSLNQAELKLKYGESNVSLLTHFQILALENSLLVQLSQKSVSEAVSNEKEQVTLREEAIMRKYMLIALKHITKLTYSKGKAITSKFYLLQGRACFYNKKTKMILTCYEQGLFTPSHLQSPGVCLYLFEGAYLMLLEEEMLREEVIAGLQVKRQAHLSSIQSRYEKISTSQGLKIQQKLISKFSLNRKQIQREILCIQKPLQPRTKSKNDSIRTSSSTKDKCSIRIRKSQKAK